jgi:hypothetical protein
VNLVLFCGYFSCHASDKKGEAELLYISPTVRGRSQQVQRDGPRLGQKRNPERNCVTHHVGSSTTFVDSLRGTLQPLARLPTREITAKNEEFSPDLNDRNAVFLNNSAEMPDREACQLCGGRDVQEHLVSGLSRCCGFCQHLKFPSFRSVL